MQTAYKREEKGRESERDTTRKKRNKAVAGAACPSSVCMCNKFVISDDRVKERERERERDTKSNKSNPSS